MVQLIDGKAMAADLCDGIALGVKRLQREHGIATTLAAVIVGDDPASQVYVRRKVAQTRQVGMRSIEHRLADDTSEAELLDLIAALNADAGIHGILVQLPLPPHIRAAAVLDAIAPHKDVDGFHPVNVGRLSTGSSGLVPCTPLGVMLLLESVVDRFQGLHAVVIGKSNIVGKPVALLLLERECTVTVTHSYTRGLAEIARSADVLVAAAGSPGLVRGNWVKPGAVVIDVGITRLRNERGTRLAGDVALEELDHARAATPVPGGVGPMTIACLLKNTLRMAAQTASGTLAELKMAGPS